MDADAARLPPPPAPATLVTAAPAPSVAPPVGALLGANLLLRLATASLGQLFALHIAGQWSHRAAWGSILVGLVGAAYYLTEVAGAPVAGRLGDARGQERVLASAPAYGLAAAVVAGVAAFLGGGALPLVVAASLAAGAATACAAPTTLALLSRGTEGDPARRTRVMAWFEITSVVGLLGGNALAGVVWDAAGAWAFLVEVPLFLAALALVRPDVVGGAAPAAPRSPTARPPLGATLRSLARRPGAAAFGVAWLCVNAVVGLWLQHAPYLFKLDVASPDQRLVGGLSGTAIGGVFGVFGALFLVGTAGWAALAGRWPRRRVMSVALVGLAVEAASVAAYNHGAHPAVLVLAVACLLLETGFVPAALAHLADLTSDHDTARGTAMGVYTVLLGLGQLSGGLFGAPIAARWQFDGLLGGTAALALVALACVTLGGGRARWSVPASH